MKKILCAVGVVALACSTAFGSVAINAATFPDATFRTYVSANFDSNSDGTLSDAEIANITGMSVFNLGVVNLKGIEHLSALRYVFCSFTYDDVNNSFNYTKFKAAYGLDCDIDDSWLLQMRIIVGDKSGLMTPMIGDVADTSTGDYILKFPLRTGQKLNDIEFFTRGTPAIKITVIFPGFIIFP